MSKTNKIIDDWEEVPKKRGRPKGSKNKLKQERNITSSTKHLKKFISDNCASYFSTGPFSSQHWCYSRDSVCFFFAGKQQRCKYFEEAVLPIDEEGHAQIEYIDFCNVDTEVKVSGHYKTCAYCGTEFLAKHGRAIYCSEKCVKEGNKIKTKERQRKHRSALTAVEGI